jgi:hypothetical protein
MPERSHYAAIDVLALQKYRFFEKLGFFGVAQGTASGAASFLRTGRAALASARSALWVTAQGAFTDPRMRPVVLRPGIGHLLRKCSDVALLPLAVEYPFWEERYPEALVLAGEPLLIADGQSRPASEWTKLAGQLLADVQDDLSRRSISRDAREFTVLVGGKSGIGGVYDGWRRCKAWASGRRFSGAHGVERF